MQAILLKFYPGQVQYYLRFSIQGFPPMPLLLVVIYRDIAKDVVKLLQRLPDEMEFWHFGDSDEAGFDILRVLREKSGRNFQPLHMQRGRIPFEQESLGRPKLKNWPFYD